ncbi:MAG: V-type ATP synthase subunit I [Spirochaetaceae bacterium]|jgi:V/A-type H+-transporting ATPase subunit I|nr:V-type ATP synthase subunit I [Spirochaetaceae bacterium]
MMRPERMKQLEITVLQRDVDDILKFLGSSGSLQFSYHDKVSARKKSDTEIAESKKYADALEKIKNTAIYLGIELPDEPSETTEKVGDEEDGSLDIVYKTVSALQNEEYTANLEKDRISDRLKALSGFEKLNIPLGDIDKLAFLNLKIGRLENAKQEELRQTMGDRAFVYSLEDNGVLVASARKDRFALEAELRKENWSPLEIPDDKNASLINNDGTRGNSESQSTTPAENLNELYGRSRELEKELVFFAEKKIHYAKNYGTLLQNLYKSYLMARIIDDIKSRLVSTESAFVLSGWIPARQLKAFVSDIDRISGGRIGCTSFDPWELESVRSGKEKIPVRLKHGAFARAFEPLVFSYGAPLYGSIDPTAITALFFTLLFAIMFGDLGQGFSLFLIGLLIGNKKIKFFNTYKNFAGPMKIIGIAAMVSGLLYGSVFSNEELLGKPTEALTLWLSQTDFGHFFHIQKSDKILNLMPEKGSLTKLFYFFGFTLAVGFILNSIGLICNIIDNFSMRRYQRAIFSKNGITGVIFFWYAVSIAIRAVIQGGDFHVRPYDFVILIGTILIIAGSPFIWALCKKDKKIFEDGIFNCFMEGVVQIIETASGYFSNSVSFLRVGAFALSHTILSFIIFEMADKVGGVVLGSLWSAIIIIFGNCIIIVLEGMIVAIQVVRLEYYEFFSKFFTETGAKFKPFSFRKRV